MHLHSEHGRSARKLVAFLVPGLILVVLAAAAGTTPAGTIDVMSREPAVFEPPPDRALVIFLLQLDRPPIVKVKLGRTSIFIDRSPVAKLRRDDYVAVLVDPGTHLIWTSDASASSVYSVWLDLRAGKRYLIRTSYFLLDDPSYLDDPRRRGELRYSSNPDVVSSHLRRIGYPKALEMAGEPRPGGELPGEFNVTWQAEALQRAYRPFSTSRPRSRRGTLSIDASRLLLRSDTLDLSIPIAEIQSARLYATMTGGQYSTIATYLHVRHGRPEAPLGVYSGVPVGGWNRLYTVVADAIAARSAAAGDEEAEVAALQPDHAVAAPAPGVETFEGLAGQFVLDLPPHWFAYDQSRALTGQTGPFGVVIFSPRDLANLPIEEAVVLLGDIDRGAIPSFFVDRQPALRKTSCAGIAERAHGRILKSVEEGLGVGRGATILGALTLEETAVGGCRGLRVEGRARNVRGAEWRARVYAVSDGRALYYFSLRNTAEHFEANLPGFEDAIATLRLAAARADLPDPT